MKNTMGNKHRNALQRTYISFRAWARDNNIYSAFHPLKSGIYGFVYKSKYRDFLIVIDSHLNKEMQKEVFCHEVEHIIYDSPEKGYIIGLNMQYTQMECKDVNIVAETLAKKIYS